MNINATLAAALEAANKLAAQEAAIDRSLADDSSSPHAPGFESNDDDATVAEFPEKLSNDVDDIAPQPVNELSDEPDTFVSVADAAAPVVAEAQRNIVKIKNLDEKAVLVQVKRRMYSPYKLDEAESKAYGAGNVNKHLFQGTDNRVKVAISKYTEVYTFVKDNTVPWTTGVELLNIDHYMDFTRGLRERIDAANAAVDDLVANWGYEVQRDLKRLQDIAYAKGKPNLADPNDYPEADEVAARFGIEVRYMPVPTTGDFRVGISDEDKASLQRQLDDATTNATRHVLTEMIEPMQRAVKKLTVKIGDDGSIFRDSLIDNMVDVANRMAKVNISDDPVIRERIKDLQSLVGTYANNKDMLRNNQSVREKAATQIDDLMSKMAGLV
jgi:hypothetical protein